MTKKIILTLILGILLVTTISAFNFDNVLTYENNNLKVKINNCDLWIGTCLNVGEELGTAELKSHKSVDEIVTYGVGRQEAVVYYDFEGWETYKHGLGEVEFIDGNTGKKVDKDYYFVEWEIKNVEINDYSNKCTLLNNGTNECKQTIVGSHLEDKGSWIRYDGGEDIPNKKIRLGVLVTIEKDDFYDVVWTIAGKKVHKHAYYSEGDYLEQYDVSGETTNIWGMAVNDTTLFVGDGASNYIINYYINGTYTGRNISSPATVSGVGICENGTRICSTSDTNDLVYVLYYNETQDFVWSPTGAGCNASASCPLSIFENYTHTFVIDNGNQSIIQYDNNKNYQRVIDVSSIIDGVFVDGDIYGGFFYLTDNEPDAIHKVYPNGTLSLDIDTSNNMTYTSGIAINSTGEIIYVGDNGNDIIDVLAGANYNVDSAPLITLNYPSNNTNSSVSSITFNCTGLDDFNLVNVSFILDGIVNETNSTGINNDYFYFTKTLSEGEHYWTCRGADNNSAVTTADERLVSIDTINPALDIFSPSGDISFHLINTNLTINWSVNDTNLDTCIFGFNGVNRTVTCNDNGTEINITDYRMNNITFWANDTSGRMNISSPSWEYDVFINSNSYVNPELGGATSIFTTNLSVSSGMGILIPYLVYNGTSYESTMSISGNFYEISKSITIPFVSSSQDLSFYWNFYMNDSTYINSSSFNQTVNTITIDDCTTNTIEIFNYTLFDEKSLNYLTDTTIEYALNVTNIGGDADLFSTNGSTTSNPFRICINASLTSSSNYSMKGTLKYYSNDSMNYAIRYYNYLNFSLTNSSVPQNVSLFDTNESLPFLLTFRDSSLALAPNILVQVDRQYLPSNDFKTIEKPVTDTNGQTTLNLIRNTVVYNLVMTDISGEVIASFNKIIPFCQDYTIGSCSLDLSASSTGDTLYDYDTDVGISDLLTYTNSTETISMSFNTLNSTAQTVRMVVVTENQFENQTICDTSLTTTTGTLTCDVSSASDSNQFFFVKKYSNGNLYETVPINTNPSLGSTGTAFGKDGYFIAILLILTISLMFSNDKQILVVMLGVGWVTVLIFGLVRGTILGLTSGGIWLIITILIFLWKLKQEEYGGG